MYGTDIGLKLQVSEARIKDFLIEAEQQRLAKFALDTRPQNRRRGISEVRVAVAKVLLRAGSRLMPEDVPATRGSSVAFELRPGQ
jgi:hypothetical protein